MFASHDPALTAMHAGIAGQPHATHLASLREHPVSAHPATLDWQPSLSSKPIHRLHEARATSSAPDLAHITLRDALPKPRSSLCSLGRRPRVTTLSSMSQCLPGRLSGPADVGCKFKVTALQTHGT